MRTSTTPVIIADESNAPHTTFHPLTPTTRNPGTTITARAAVQAISAGIPPGRRSSTAAAAR